MINIGAFSRQYYKIVFQQRYEHDAAAKFKSNMYSGDKVRQDLSKLLVETLAGTFDLSPRLLTPFEKELCLLDNLQMTYTGRCLLTIPSGPRFLSGRLWYQISELRHAMH
jgi:hypothetical protein